MATRLRGCVRAVDTVARFGGGEFAVLVEERAARPTCAPRRPGSSPRWPSPVLTEGRPATVTASVGIALSRPGLSTGEILREADTAMYTAKTTGKCRHVLAGV